MPNHTEYQFICHMADYLPDRQASKRGPKPIPKKILITELYKLFKTNCVWRNIRHSSTCRNHPYELQRRGEFKHFFYGKFSKRVTADNLECEVSPLQKSYTLTIWGGENIEVRFISKQTPLRYQQSKLCLFPKVEKDII